MSRTVIASARRSLGPVGAMLPVLPGAGVTAEMKRAAAVRLEAAGYRTAWSNELVGKDVFTQAAIVLAATERLSFGTSIANLWARPAQTASAAADQLADAFPGRFVLGLGVGYPQQAESVGLAFGKPLATVRSYLGAMADAPAYPRILAAMGPKMLALAGEVTDGALPAGAGRSSPLLPGVRSDPISCWSSTSAWTTLPISPRPRRRIFQPGPTM